MPAPFIVIFSAIQNRIIHQVPEIAHIALDMGQLNTRNRPQLSWPCLLIDFEHFSFSDLGAHVQMATGTIALRLGTAPLSGTGQNTPEAYRTKALSCYNLEAQLHMALHAWSLPGDYMGAMMRTSVRTQSRTDGYHVRELRYTLSYEDNSTRTEQQMAPVSMVVNPVIDL